MSIELRIASGARAGERARFEKSVITVGRHPQNDLRFDAERDLDVSAHHAELRAAGGRWTVRDLGSTNGTFVSGERIAAERELRDGEVLAFGEHGPRVEVRLLPAGARGARTTERWAAVRRETSALRWALVGLATIVVAGGALMYAHGRREARRRDAAIADLLARNTALGAQYDRDLTRLTGRVLGLDSALMVARRESDSLRLRIERDARAGGSLAALADQQQLAEQRREALDAASRVDYTAIAQANGPAVAMLAVEMPDGRTFSGTAFNLAPAGRLVTNRHLLVDERGDMARRIAVIFADTRTWLPARVEHVSADADLALLRVEGAGARFPAVRGLAPGGAAPVGAPVAIIGYPLGTGTPMEGAGTAITARSTLGAGTVSKSLADVLQIDAYAGEGSSGSPVFDAMGQVIGVVFGGAEQSGGRIVYAVPVEALAAFVR